MCGRFVAVVFAIAAVLASTAFAQTTSRSSARASAAKSYTPARTPWGDPDLQGTYTNSNEYATPLERPARFAGRTLDDISDKELASIREGAEQEAIAGLAP